MLPNVLSHELMEGINAFLRSTFPSSTPSFRGVFDEILTGTGRDKLFQGPYYRIGLPFRPGRSGTNFFPRLETEHPPYIHQEEAWKRLKTAERKSTLVATGTGSGKTECFTYPILDHILDNPSRKGIKAIILYPMNALATDQARRFAEEVHSNKALKDKVRVGLYVGGQDAGGGSRSMTKDSVITSREEMRKSPPDILMTNYKMLDYLLIRQADRGIWADNQPDTLSYLVVDELHTFDGAQGTDLACLIRRVKARLKTPKDHLCCVGTSATLGGPDSSEAMIKFAELIFGENFAVDDIIKESRKKAEEHIVNGDELNLEVRDTEPPKPEHRDALSPANYSSIRDFVTAQLPLWFESSFTNYNVPQPDLSTPEGCVELAGLLRRHNFLRTFLRYFRNGILSEEEILADLKSRRSTWEAEHHKLLITSFVSLCAVARDAPRDSAYFLQIRSELWMRELSRMVASVNTNPALRFSMDLAADHPQKHLAAMHCRECGVMGWGALQKTNEDRLLPDLDRFYQAFFSVNPDPRLRFAFPQEKESSDSLVRQYLCGGCLSMFESRDGVCPHCAAGPDTRPKGSTEAPPSVCTVPVDSHLRTIQRNDMRVADKSCPYCDSSSGLTIVGSRSASLTSVGLSQLFGSPFNDDKKAMAFSDSVQDASHRAGFFAGRTYSIVLRTALCRVIDQHDQPVSLAELAKKFPEHWQNELGKEDFVGTFIPPTIEWLAEFESFREEHKLPGNTSLPIKVRERMEWEVFREFGMHCRIGRTLEKSGAACSSPEPLLLAQAAEHVLKIIHDLSAAFSSVNEMDVRRLLTAACERLRGNGGISHQFLESYMMRKGDEFPFNAYNNETLPRLPKAGRGIRPTFFSSFPKKHSFERLISSSRAPTWMEYWAQKWLRGIIGDQADEISLGPVIEALVEALTASRLWQKHEISRSDHEYAWALDPEQLLITTDPLDHACSACGHQVTTSRTSEAEWKDMPCLRHRCDGTYRPSRTASGSYFGNLYRKGDVVRLRTAEHTGMLERPVREKIEAEFMREPSLSTDTKLLSCTPTMEMGVDVGDLSTVLLCSVPPEMSNYVQRVGRGGRRDGNSLALTVATSTAHDLTYYENPLAMLAGDVHLPAIFLRAPAVLERQLTAYCIDRWIEDDPSAQIPAEMEAIYVLLSKQMEGKRDDGAFPLAFYEYIELHLTDLLEGFVAMFDKQELDEASHTYLEAFIKGDNDEEGSLSFKINRALMAAYKDREALFEKRRKLHKSISSNKARKPRDEKIEDELKHMVSERKAVSRLIKDINKKLTLNFLTDEGLIPNYAFPEEGVTLRSVILKKPDQNQDENKLVKLKFEHVRPAEAAITELAPGSSFYVEGRKLTVDQVSIDKDDYEEWHFCRSCSHMEPVTAQSESYSSCPRCHCNGWQDSSLRQKMLRMRQVFVTAWDKNVRNLDQKDDRDLTTFNKQTSIDHKKEAVRKSYMLRAEGTSLAFDFLDLITLRETNFGEEQFGAETVQIGGRSLHGLGFRMCSSCGKIQSSRTRDANKHDISCRLYGKDDTEEEFETTFLLYRQLESEAIKLLIPSLNQDENVDTQSFVAAIHLGLKERFGGHLSHLKLSVQHQPIAGSPLRSQHVYIYDGVPGGTGYLKELTRNAESFLQVVEMAYSALEGCACAKEPELDGCYKCIKAYRFRFVHNLISRRTAMQQLKRILDHRDLIEERSADESLINPLLESELERRFIEALRREEGFILNQEIVDGRPGYLLKVQQAAWKLIPQVELGPEEDVSLPCRPDFILKPLRTGKGLPVAVFLDGFAFHADVELNNNRIADDISKRNAIRMSGRYLVWSLTWADLSDDRPEDGSLLSTAYNKLAPIITETAPEISELAAFRGNDWNSWDLLLQWIQYVAAHQGNASMVPWHKAASLLACNFPTRAALDSSGLNSSMESLIAGSSPEPTNASQPEYMYSLADTAGLRSISAVPITSLQQKSLDGALSALWFDDTGDMPTAEFQSMWQELLRMNNMLQFVPRFVCFTRLMINKGGISNLTEWLLEHEDTPQPDTPPTSLSEEQLEEIELLDPGVAPSLVPLLKAGELGWPEFGYEGTNASGTCVSCMLEVAWPDRKLGIALEGEDPNHFTSQGWTVISSAILDSETIKTTYLKLD